MTNTTQTATRPIVKSICPDLYARHTAHLSRAENLSYNYSVLDDYIVQNWDSKTMEQIAQDTNEYFNRVVYRVGLLQTLKLIKCNKNTQKSKLMQERKLLTVRIKQIDAQIKSVA